MFLMNPPPVVALQTKWGPFGPSGSYRFPVNFSESEDDISGTPINTKVQMIITNLQTDESSHDVNNDFNCIMQKNRNGDKCFAADARLIKVHSQECVKVGLPAQLRSTEEEGAEFGPLVLDSDSDDSVDRDIEEAIQEYLKNKGETCNSHSSDADCSRTTEDNKPSVPQSSKTHMGTVKTERNKDQAVEPCERLQHTYSDSNDSDDSLEDSINAEIEQFLWEKKPLETTKREFSQNQKTNPFLKVKSEKTVKRHKKASCTMSKKTFEQSIPVQLKVLKTQPQSSSPISASVTVSKRFKENAPVIKVTSIVSSGSGPRRVSNDAPQYTIKDLMDESSSSSSDDGIEEAIKLFQMEKQKEGKQAMHYSNLANNPFNERNIESSLTHVSSRCVPVESPKKRKKRKRDYKSTEQKHFSSLIDPHLKALKPSRACAPPVEKMAKCELSLRASCRAESDAELLCAEAILDISKTIMPPQMEVCSQPLGNAFDPPNATLYSDSDDSVVDSDDSIEQEIRSFLAQKAQSEGVLKSDNSRLEPPISLSNHNNPMGSHKSSQAKLSLTHKRKLKKEHKGSHHMSVEKCVDTAKATSQLTEKGACGIQPSHSRSGLSSGGKVFDTNMSGKCERLVFPSECKAADKAVASFDMNLSSSTVTTVERGEERLFFRTRERSCSDDKSSSLDSDEDLDAAIKDLLRSRRKCKKKAKDLKPQCKKKVRFGETEIQDLDKFHAVEQKDYLLKSPSSLKSCLLKPKDIQETVENVSTENLQENLEHGKCGSVPQEASTSKTICTTDTNIETISQHCIVKSDDTSSVDSDDSIEQEIRKFLAEKAKESAIPVLPEKALVLSNCPEKDLSQVNERSTERATEPSDATSAFSHQLNDCKPSESCTSQIGSVNVGLQNQQNNVQSVMDVNRLCGKERNPPSDHNLRRLGDSSVAQAVQSTEFLGKGMFPVTFLGNFIAGLQYIPGKVRTVLVNGQRVYSTVPSMISLNSNVALGLEVTSDKTVQTSEIQAGNEKEMKKPCLTLPVRTMETGRCDFLLSENVKKQSLVASQINHSSKQTPCNVMTSQGPHLHAKTGLHPATTVAVEREMLLVTKEKCNVANVTEETKSCNRQTIHTRSCPVVLRPDRGLECTYLKPAHRVDQREEAVDKSPCKISACVEESKISEDKRKGSDFSSFSSTIDPGIAVQPYIALSPEQMCKNLFFRGCHSNIMNQVRSWEKKIKIP